MDTTMNRSAFEKLIAENLDWLLKQERTLERNHIEAILRDAANKYYPVKFRVPRVLQTQNLSYQPTGDYLYLNFYGDITAREQLRHFLKQFENHDFVQLINDKGNCA